MKYIVMVFMLFFLATGLSASVDVNATINKELNVKGQVILETIQNLEKFGYITARSAVEAKKQMVFDNRSLLEMKQNEKITDKATTKNNSDVTYSEYLTFTNIIKILALIAFLITFRGIIEKFLFIFTSIPVYVYQVVLLSLSLYMTFFAENIWSSQAYYLSVFAVISNLLILGWIITFYEETFDRLFKMISLKIPPQIVAFFYMTLYFGYFAIMLDSSFLGIFTLVAFVAMFGFIIFSTGIETVIGYENEAYMNVGMFVNGIIIAAYSYIVINNIPIPYLDVFSVGIEYVATLAFIVSLLINSSFMYTDKPSFAFSIVLMVVAFGLSVTGSLLFNLEVIPAIINTGFFIFLLGWVGYLTSKVSGILMSLAIGLSLYGFALLIESKPELFVTSLF